MSYQQKDGQGSLFRNDKQGNEKRPDWRGSLTLDGKEYEVAGWERTSQKGTAYISLSGKPKQARQERQEAPQTQNTQPEEFNDSIPF